MIKYIYNTNGDYVAYIINGKYCFSSDGNSIGFMNGIDLYNYSGEYLGTLTSDDRIIKSRYSNKANVKPIKKPNLFYLPLTPFKRYKMSSLGSSYVDIFIDSKNSNDMKLLDKKYSKYLDCELYASDNHFLGVLSTNRYDSKSLANKYGKYGSQYERDSIYNKYGTYGSEYNSKSPFNKYSTTPAYLKNKSGKIVARVSDNIYLGNNIIKTTELFNWFNDKVLRG